MVGRHPSGQPAFTAESPSHLDFDAIMDHKSGAATSPSGQPHDRLNDSSTRAIAIPAVPVDDVPEEQPVELSVTARMLSAVTGSILTSLLVTPLDVVRVRLQSQTTTSSSTSASTNFELRPNPEFPFPRSFQNMPPNLGISQCCREVFWVNNNAPYCVADAATASLEQVHPTTSSALSAAESCAVDRLTFTSTFDGLRKIARNEGLPTLWRGLSPTLAMAIPGNVVYFAGYDWLRHSKRSPFTPYIPDVYAPLIAGSTARVLAALCVSPIELFRTRMQAARGNASAAATFADTLAGVRDMVASQGPLTLWRGLNLTLWRDVPFSAFYWWGYEHIRNAITDARERRRGHDLGHGEQRSRTRSSSRNRQDHASTLMDSFAAGAIAGGLAAIVTTPFDVGKTRQQVFRYEGDVSTTATGDKPSRTTPASETSSSARGTIRPEDRSMPRFLWHIFREEGFPGLFKGWAARTLKVAPACAIMISTYEVGKKYAQRRKEEEQERGRE